MEKLLKSISSSEKALLQVEQSLAEVVKLVPDNNIAKRLEVIKARHAEFTLKLRSEQIRLLEFIGRLMAPLGIERTPIWHGSLEFFGFKLEEGILRARTKTTIGNGVLYENVKNAVDCTNDFPFEVVYEKLFAAIRSRLEEMDGKITKDTEKMAENIGEVLKLIEEMKSRLPETAIV